MRILITNDDGIKAPGILALKAALDPIGEVTVVAPERPRSASGHAITLHKPLRLTETPLPDGSIGLACNGTPSDCVSLGLEVAMEGHADLVISGINDGANLGWDLTYSGTVSAAMEGAILGIPAIAISVACAEAEQPRFDAATSFVVELASTVTARKMARWTLLNVNVPNLPADRIRGVEVTHQGRTQYTDRVERRTDPRGRAYYWLSGYLEENTPEQGSDVHAVQNGFISVTPLDLDLTAAQLIDVVRTWNLRLPH